MTTTETETSSKSKRSGASRRASVENARPSPKTKSNPLKAKMPETANAQNEVRVTKHDRVLTLLGQPNGASIEDMMQEANWQQHSVRGFLAGTVKRKLGFTLTSTKLEGDVRRYRIEKKRGR